LPPWPRLRLPKGLVFEPSFVAVVVVVVVVVVVRNPKLALNRALQKISSLLTAFAVPLSLSTYSTQALPFVTKWCENVAIRSPLACHISKRNGGPPANRRRRAHQMWGALLEELTGPCTKTVDALNALHILAFANAL